MPAAALSDAALDRLNTLARRFGCPKLIPLRRKEMKPEHIQYLDLLPERDLSGATPLPQAVAEFQGRAVLYFLDGTASAPLPQQLQDLQQLLANRGEHAVLAVSRPGDLTLYPLNLDRKELLSGRFDVVQVRDERAPFLFQELASGSRVIEGRMTEADPVFSEIHRLMSNASLALAGEEGEGPLDGLTVLSMTGRALFFRFLMDRRIVDVDDLPSPLRSGGLQGIFSSAESAAQISVWLDETFNGDLLPLVEAITKQTPTRERKELYLQAYQEAEKLTDGAVFLHLEAILKGYEAVSKNHVQMMLPGAVDWTDLNFRHIPVGVLSQVYESFSHQWDSDAARADSVHYTPKNLAKLLVDQALAGLDEPHRAKVLDPACGAGVFLVLAFREIVRRRWEKDRKEQGDDAKRPGKAVIHEVLYKQLCGFDVSEPALRLAALGLYVTAIELNEITKPLSELHAPAALKNLVLFNFAPKDGAERKRGFVLGSLGDDVDKSFDGQFDAVIGNPPWTRDTLKQGDKAGTPDDKKRRKDTDRIFTAIGRRVLLASGLNVEAASYESPGGVPDVPFIWRATEWAKPGGVIAYALDARLILSQSKISKAARDAIFKTVMVTGILNGSDLEKTAVWETIDEPWLLLWARNTKPDIEHAAFNLLTPVRENSFSSRGDFRLDYQAAYPVPVRSVIHRGWLLKALAMGTMLDVEVMEKIEQARTRQTVGSFWSGKLQSCQGFGFKSRNKPPPDWLLGLSVFVVPTDETLFDKKRKLSTYEETYGKAPLECPRQQENYKHPLVLVARTPREGRDTPKAYRELHEDVCFDQYHYGYSAACRKDGKLLTAIIHVIVHSELFRHYCYMRSAYIGAKHRIITKEDVDSFPFPILEELTDDDRNKALELASLIDARSTINWKSVDNFVCGLFGLSASDAEVVHETVEHNGPYQKTRGLAAQPPDSNALSSFASCLGRALQPLFKIVKQKVRVQAVDQKNGEWNPPWRFVTVLLEGDTFEPTPAFIAKLMRVASETSASRVVMPVPSGGLVMGLLNQRRFWTRSRARLCALHLAGEHLDKNFPLPSRP
ncbi:MAG: N-6 DNA methylase [Prosthecobacter sp.]|uniref:N-6 DNA methylase n=1 Tax=Prosthecobacter sp. TaxID=1965333 RepID=UPI003BAF68A8